MHSIARQKRLQMSCRYETFRLDGNDNEIMLVNSPGGSTLQWAAGRGLLRLTQPVICQFS